MKELITLFKALSDETRLKILVLLMEGERCVNDIAESLQSTQPNISFHLGILLECGLISGHQIGKNIYYFINPQDIFTRFLIYGIYERVSSKNVSNGYQVFKIKGFRRRLFLKEDIMNHRGRHSGSGFGRGFGPSGYCICPKCKEKIVHTPGVPCMQERCPKCGGVMVREGSPHDRSSKKTEEGKSGE
ncbi:MAG: ArsR/SmtB family transcription factor [Myxococcota bacterium]